MSVAGVVLAAGFSRRLGRPKQNVVVAGETLLQRTVRVAREAGLRPILVVVRDNAEGAESMRDSDAMLVQHTAAAEGIAASIRAGVLAAEKMLELVGVVVMACDQVSLTAEHLRALYEHRERLTGSGYAGKTAIPAYFPRASWPGLRVLRGDTGAQSLLRGAPAVVCEELSVDVDTEEDVLRAQRIHG